MMDFSNELEDQKTNFTLATFQSRILAYLVDQILITILFFIIFGDRFGSDFSYEQIQSVTNQLMVPLLLLYIVYQFVFVYFYGATLGKILLKIRVVSIGDLSNPTFSQSLLRSVLRILSETVFYLGFIYAFTNPLRQTFHDKIANTLVVNA